MLELMGSGGWMLVPIWLCGFAALGLFLERWFHLHRAQIKQEDFLSGIFTLMNRGNRAEAVTICNETPGPVAHLVRTGLLHADGEDEQRRSMLIKAGLEEIPRLEKNLSGLYVLAQLLPLLGLLGTLVGLLELFMLMEAQAPLTQVGDLSGGMWKALLSSVVAISFTLPALAGYHFLLSRVERITSNMEYAVNELCRFLDEEWVERGESNG
jgi:biopolymer transport protein ExbB